MMADEQQPEPRAPGPITYTRIAGGDDVELARAVGGLAVAAYGHPTAPDGIVISVRPNPADGTIKLAAWPARSDRK